MIVVLHISQGFNGADLRNVCTEAGMSAIRAERDYVIHEDFMKVNFRTHSMFMCMFLSNYMCPVISWWKFIAGGTKTYRSKETGVHRTLQYWFWQRLDSIFAYKPHGVVANESRIWFLRNGRYFSYHIMYLILVFTFKANWLFTYFGWNLTFACVEFHLSIAILVEI